MRVLNKGEQLFYCIKLLLCLPKEKGWCSRNNLFKIRVRLACYQINFVLYFLNALSLLTRRAPSAFA